MPEVEQESALLESLTDFRRQVKEMTNVHSNQLALLMMIHVFNIGLGLTVDPWNQGLEILINQLRPDPSVCKLVRHRAFPYFASWAASVGRREDHLRIQLIVSVIVIAHPTAEIAALFEKNWRYGLWDSKPKKKQVTKCLSNKKDRARTKKCKKIDQDRGLLPPASKPGRKTELQKKEIFLRQLKMGISRIIALVTANELSLSAFEVSSSASPVHPIKQTKRPREKTVRRSQQYRAGIYSESESDSDDDDARVPQTDSSDNESSSDCDTDMDCAPEALLPFDAAYHSFVDCMNVIESMTADEVCCGFV